MRRGYEPLSVEERVEIYRLQADGRSQRAIAGVLGRAGMTRVRTFALALQGRTVKLRDSLTRE